ncbi:MAG: OB-fold protein [Phycisphaerae bacterium]
MRGDELFKGQCFIANGVISNIRMLGESYYVKFKYGNKITTFLGTRIQSGVGCEFDNRLSKDEEKRLGTLSRGQSVLIVGKGDGRSFGVVLFHHCAIVATASEAMDYIGDYYFKKSLSDRGMAKVNAWWRKAAAAGNSFAMCNLGNRYAHQPVPDYAKAMAWYRKAEQSGDPQVAKLAAKQIKKIEAEK